MSPRYSQALRKEDDLQMEIWDSPHPPGFMFQQYRSFDDKKASPYEALAILKNADGSSLANNLFFDELRGMDPEWQLAVDRFLVPLAIKAAADKKRLPVAVNVHVSSLINEEFLKLVRQTMAACGLNQTDVLFEIVEPHIPSAEQVEKLAAISIRTNPENGFSLIIDDHDFETGEDRLRLLAPFCDMVKIDMSQAAEGFTLLQNSYPHLGIVLERVTFNDRDLIFALYPGVLVQGI